MNAAAYSVIRNFLPTHPQWAGRALLWANAKFSNYGVTGADGKEYVGSWHQRRLTGTGQTRSPAAPNSAPEWTRVCHRGVADQWALHGAFPTENLFPHTFNLDMQAVSGDRLRPADGRLGDFAAPWLYPVKQAPAYYHHDPYIKMPMTTIGPRQYNETQTLASRRHCRDTGEAVRGSWPAGHVPRYSPWVLPAWSIWTDVIGEAPLPSLIWSKHHCRQQVGDLAAMRAEHILHWNVGGCFQFPNQPSESCDDAGANTIRAWQETQAAYIEAATAWPFRYEVGLGGGPMPTNMPSALWYITADTGQPGEIAVPAPTLDPPPNSVLLFVANDLIVTFRDYPLSADEPNEYMQVMSEASVQVSSGVPFTRDRLRGKMFAWDWQHQAWVDRTVVEAPPDANHWHWPQLQYESDPVLVDEGGPTMTQYGFYTPDGTDQTYGTRRPFWFRIMPELASGESTRRRFVSRAGDPGAEGEPNRVRLKFVHLYYPPAGQTVPTGVPFTSKYDLIQVYSVPVPSVANGGSVAEGGDQEQGADVNYSSTVDEEDVAAFSGAFVAGTPSTDFNGVGVVDAEDVASFVEAFVTRAP